MRTRVGVSAILVLISLTLGACVGTGQPRGGERDIEDRSGAIVVGAFNFTESRLLAEIYSQALREAGFPAEVLDQVASREIMEPALEQGEVDLVPEYVGTALTFLSATSQAPVPSGPAYAKLKRMFQERGIVVLDAAPGENRNEFVVRNEFALEHDLEDISDLRSLAGELSFGGPPECPSRALCLLGLEDVYGLEFETFLPLDSGGPRTVAAIRAREIDVALLFTTHPALNSNDLLVLRDDLHLQPPENIVPVVRQQVATEHGAAFIDAINRVTSRLNDRELRRLNERVGVDGAPVETAAREWLTEQGLL